SAADAGDAISKQVAAVDLLHQASDVLAAAQEQAEREMATRALEAIKQALEEMRAAQVEILDKTEPIRKRHAENGRVTRPDGINMNKLAAQQSDLAERLDATQKKLAGAIVYDFVCKQARGHMQTASEKLRGHEPGDAAQAERAAAE